MSIFQILASLFALFMLYIVNIHQKKSRLSQLEVSFWYSIWFLFIVIALFPNLLLGLADILRFTRVFDLLVVAGMMVLTVLVIVNYFQQKESRLKLEEFIRREAIFQAKKRRKRKR